MSYLVVMEGSDGVGKATQSKRLVENIKAAGHDAVLYSFPTYETELGQAIRRNLTGETSLCSLERIPRGALTDEVYVGKHPDNDLMFQCMMLANKYDKEPEIEDHLRAGRFVVCDRWKDSSRAYGAADGLPPDWLERVHRRLTSASLTFLLQVPEAIALERRPALRDRYEKDRSKQALVAERYAELAKKGGWRIVDGAQSVEKVSEIIWWHMAARFGL